MCSRKARRSQHTQADEVHGQIQHDHSNDSGHEATRQIATRIAHLAGHEGGRLPAAIRKGHGNHSGADSAQQSKRYGPVQQRQGVNRASA